MPGDDRSRDFSVGPMERNQVSSVKFVVSIEISATRGNGVKGFSWKVVTNNIANTNFKAHFVGHA